LIGAASSPDAAQRNPGAFGERPRISLRCIRATALHYNYFRDYEPRTGRYIESDPIGGISTFLFAEGQPLSLVDPLGLCALSPRMKKCGEGVSAEKGSGLNTVRLDTFP